MTSNLQCPVEDDHGVRCQNIMTRKEIREDGYCIRCAESLWGWLTGELKEVVFKKADSREM